MSQDKDTAPLPEDWSAIDSAQCYAELVRINRERLLAGEPLHPAWRSSTSPTNPWSVR